MKKISILKRKIIRAYNNKNNRETSEYKGYPKGTYFGYTSLNQLIDDTINSFREYYGYSLKKWR